MSEFTKDELIVFGSESKLVQGKIGYYNQEDWPVVVAEINPHHECVRNPLELAYVFSAAPDMLEALVELTAMVERQPDFNDDGDGLTLSRCYEAIEKAKGE